jgi:ABC-2 type transport system permease protein
VRALRELTWVELKLFVREPLTVLFVLVLPVVVLYILNGVFGEAPAAPEVWDGLRSVDFYTPSYAALVVATVGVLSVPVHLAGYREQGVLRRFRASALRSWTLVGAHLLVAAALATVGAVLLSVVSTIAYDAAIPHDWLGLVAAFLLVSLAFASLGVLLGLVLPTARAAQGLGVLLFFVFQMLGGAGPPREVLPATLRRIGDGIPLTYAGDLLRGPWLGQAWDLRSAGVMLGLLLVSAALTGWRLRAIEMG